MVSGGVSAPPSLPQIPSGQVPHLHELTKQNVPESNRYCKEVNSRVLPMQFSNGREQGFPGYTIWKGSDILNHNMFHVRNAQRLDIPIVEQGRIQLFR